MQSFAKAILISILCSIFLMMFVSLSLFFPWYSTLVIETFNLSQVVAGDNYLKQTYYDNALSQLESRPIFRDKKESIKITVKNDNGYTAIGHDDEYTYYYSPENDKPYCQRGRPLTIKIEAVYPLTVRIWGDTVEKAIHLDFSLTTVGLKHYKDLNFYDELP